ncbi:MULTISPECIES: hypothetical protein [unclassified Chelatococcus]|uniref:hypothetical protein n=1 Tax=unclassified Chelatococcus TaxID=2638111 RepID=UPI001BCD5A8D|nr:MULTISPECIES: hypothetical protein [unclassified Chelatococcus]MBS7696199.1 hypothetical protein [Chelatococcus sp. YT9]MBX3557774.1 hypothetical protein [Chelatococcus sp.]
MTRSADPRPDSRFSIALAVIVMSSATTGLPLLLMSPAEAATTCIKMPCGGTAKSISGSTDGFPAEEPDFSGSFRVKYSPIMCVKAPCPPGSYSIRASAPGEFNARVGRVVLRAANGETEIFHGRYIGDRGLSVAGDVWIDGHIAYVAVRRTIDND